VEKHVINKNRSFRIYVWKEILKTKTLYDFQVLELCKKAEQYFGTSISTKEGLSGDWGSTMMVSYKDYPISYDMWKAAEAAGYTFTEKDKNRVNKTFGEKVLA